MADPDWKSLAHKAMRNMQGFEVLLERMDTVIVQLATYYCPIDHEGAAQEARLHLYRMVYVEKRVDLTKSSNTIRIFLQGICRNRIIRESKSLERRGMNCRYVCDAALRRPKSDRDFARERPEILPLNEKNF